MIHYQHSIFGILMITFLAGCTAVPSARPQALVVEPTPASSPSATEPTQSPAPAATLAQPTRSPSTVVPAQSPAPAATSTPASAPSAAVAARDERRSTPAAEPSAAARAATDRARSDLARELGVAQSTIEVLGVQPRYGASTKSDSAGPPDGWSIRLGLGEDVYLYLVDAHGALKRVPAHR